MPDIISRPYTKEGEDTYERVFGKKDSAFLIGWPVWCHKLTIKKLTQREFDDLPEYSTSLPDSYKRPLDEGGRPWKRNINVFGKANPQRKEMWLYCEYRNSEKLGMLDVFSAHIEIV